MSHEDKKRQIIQLLKNAAPKSDRQDTNEGTRRAKILSTLLVTSLIATMLPSPTINTIASIAAVLIGLHLWRLTRRQPTPLSSKFKLTLAGLVAASMISGCSPALFNGDHPDILGFLRDRGPIREGQVWGVKVLGIEAKPATAEIAQAKAGVEEIQALEVREGFGLVSVAMVKVYGE